MKKICILLLLLGVGLSGCVAAGMGKGAVESFSRQDVDIGFVRKIAVLPLENNSKDDYASERVRNVLMTQVLARGLFDVVDKGVIDSLLHEEAAIPGKPLDRQTLQRIGQRLNVQAVMLGSIDQAVESRKGSVTYPELSITLRLLEVESGLVIWQASGHESGDSVVNRLFGLASTGIFEVAQKLVDRMLSTVPE